MPHALLSWWRQRDPREQTLLALAGAVLALALVWMLALAPALKTLRQHDARVAELQGTLSRMQALQAQAQALQAQAGSAIDANLAQQALQQQTTALLGKQADLSLRAGGASVTLRTVTPAALARWLTSVRAEAHAKVELARLQRSGEGWSGTVQLSLPQ
ncbi:type II secretion system protein GspM [Curvibacter sp. APW13]|uniref:type II secretion system protein GspM n=1 Tax=Curvibacter sp. APW13 TaxID=3077236 RepID=UPI0028DE875E|nr:type II secretion system protein GspM [Curvibacter sp. APW13]MDT8992559.1 type II secretion system protein GspM [Curvibacter sp. APW13]